MVKFKFSLIFFRSSFRSHRHSRQDSRISLMQQAAFLFHNEFICEQSHIFRQRFPYWFGNHDRRNGDLLDKMRKFQQLKGFKVENKCPFLFNLAYVTVNVTSFGAVFTCPDDT